MGNVTLTTLIRGYVIPRLTLEVDYMYIPNLATVASAIREI